MCGVKLSDRKANVELLSRLGIESVSAVVRRGRLRWLGHLERKDSDDWVSAWRSMVVESVKGSGRPRKTWWQCVDEDMAKLNLSLMDTDDRAKWRNGILGNRLARAVARKKKVGNWPTQRPMHRRPVWNTTPKFEGRVELGIECYTPCKPITLGIICLL